MMRYLFFPLCLLLNWNASAQIKALSGTPIDVTTLDNVSEIKSGVGLAHRGRTAEMEL